MNTEIRIYVADLAAYNAGILHGAWIDATDDIEDIQEQINEMLANSPEDFAEEYAIHDYEGFGNYQISEYEGIKSVHEIACFIEEYPEVGGELLNYFCNINEARIAMEENYSGYYESVADYAQELTEDTTKIPEHLAYYIDYEKMGRDMALNGDIFTIETRCQKVHVFWSH